MDSSFKPLTGRCCCGKITYTLLASPLCVHCCHCTYCARETGSAFALNILIESSNLQVTGSLTKINTPSESGAGQVIARCPTCCVGLFSYYGGAGELIAFVKAGTLDDESRQRIRPDVHIYTTTKAEWVDLRAEAERGVKICQEYYEKDKVWSVESLERLRLLKEKAGAETARRQE